MKMTFRVLHGSLFESQKKIAPVLNDDVREPDIQGVKSHYTDVVILSGVPGQEFVIPFLQSKFKGHNVKTKGQAKYCILISALLQLFLKLDTFSEAFSDSAFLN